MTESICWACAWWHRQSGFCIAEGEYTAVDGTCAFWQEAKPPLTKEDLGYLPGWEDAD